MATRDMSGLANRTDSLPILTIHLQVRRFDVWPGQFVEFAADWRLSRLSGDRRIGLTCHSQFTELALGEDATMLASQRQVITRLAAQIATQARNWVRDNRDVCVAP
ncbi:ABC-type transport auxiliary lipoprotein family protein [Sodalis sp. RH24]|uniref:ABC-type transport auxiliary lipoprotein family protein n=1 Tax=unclassified Sodalis (in: enterobacteria) TaxID=2636512 RepID=UPI0039B56513